MRILKAAKVSIPFREDLYSDKDAYLIADPRQICTFPSLSGKTSIRTYIHPPGRRCSCWIVSIPFREDLYSDFIVGPDGRTYPTVVSIPFREDLYSDY